VNPRRLFVIPCVLAILVAGCTNADPDAPETSGLTSLAPVTTTTTSPPDTQPTVPPTLPVGAPAGICRSYEDPIVRGVVAIEEVTEASGIAVSRTHPDVVWMHNDSGGGPFVYATTLSGEPMGAFELDSATFDWEDMALGPGPDPGTDYLYIGDIGDNFHIRPDILIHRIAEPVPDPAGGFVADVDEITLVYPEPGHDAESLFVDPVTGDLFVVTKPEAGGVAIIYSTAGSSLTDGAEIALTEVGRFQLDPGLYVSAAAIDASGMLIAFRGYNEVWVWQRSDLSFVATFAAEPCNTPSTAEVQGEAISFAAEGYSYFTMSEGSLPDINYVFSIFD